MRKTLVHRGMPKWMWILISIVLSSAIYFSIRYGLRPKPIPLMNPSNFASHEELGVVSFRRLFQPLRSERIVVLGYEPDQPESLMTLQGLFKAGIEARVKVQKIYVFEDLELPSYFDRFSKESFGEKDLPRLRAEIGKARKRNGTIFFIAPSLMTTHLNENSMTRALESSSSGPIFSLSQFPLSFAEEVLEKYSDACTDLDPRDTESRIHCITFRYAKSQSRRRLDLKSLLGAIERYGLKEYLIFIYRPAQTN